MRRRPNHDAPMKTALALAGRGCGRTRPNPPVGAVILREGRVVGRGWHRRAGLPHAEIEAIAEAGAAAHGGTLYVTLEPCSTHGRTPPCTDAIIAAGIKEVVMATRDPNPRHRGRGTRLLRKAGIRVVEGVCEKEARRLIAPFAKWITTGMPYVTLKLGMSLDGRIADKRGASRWITGPESRKVVHELRSRVDAIMVGAGTALADDPSLLPGNPSSAKTIYRVIVDSAGRLPVSAKVLNDGHSAQTIMAVTGRCTARRASLFRGKGAQVWTMPGRGRVSLRALMKRLGKQGLLHILCEGGGEMAESLVRDKLADEIILFVAPIILGGGTKGASMSGPGWRLDTAPSFTLAETAPHGRDLMIRITPVL